MAEPILTPIVPGGAADGGQTPPVSTSPSVFNDLKTKKGFKSEEDLAKSYVEAEQNLGRHQNISNKVKQQLESAGYTMDEDGNIKPSGNREFIPTTPTNVSQDVIYDPYTGTPLTDPIALQLARLPVGQREMFIFNAMQEQRDRNQGLSFQADQEVLTKPQTQTF